MAPLDSLLAVANAYTTSNLQAGEKRLSESRISTIVLNDGKRIKNVRNGADMGGKLIGRCLQWYSDNWPSSAEWPSVVFRPEISIRKAAA